MILILSVKILMAPGVSIRLGSSRHLGRAFGPRDGPRSDVQKQTLNRLRADLLSK